MTKVGRGNAGNAAEWVTQQIGYDATGNVSAITDGRGNTTNAYYDANGWFLTETRSPSLPVVGQLSTQYRYYGVDTNGCASGGFGMYGLLKCTIDPNSQATTYAYDHYGRLRKLVKPYDTYAHPTEEYFYYDSHSPFFTQRFVRKQSGVGVARPGYDSGWWQCATCGVDLNALGFWERTFSDGLGRTIETQRPMADWAYAGGQMAIAWTSYDAFGRAWEQSAPYQEAYAGANYRAPNTGVARTTTTYDGLSRVKSVIGPDGAVTTHAYGLDNSAAQGYTPTQAWAVHSVVDANSHAKQQVSDGLGRMRMVREFNGTNPWTIYVDQQNNKAETRYDYDALGNLIDVWDAANNNTHIAYDALGRKNWMSDPDMGYWQYLYDANGNLISQTDAKGQTLTFDYDALNRLTYKRHNGVALAWHIYDAWWDGTPKPNLKGRRTGAVAYVDGAWNNSKTWEYDARGRSAKQTTYTDVGNFDDSYVYDSADRVTQMTYPTGERVVTGYDPASQPVRLHSLDWYASGTSVDYVASASYNALGQLKQANYGNGSRDQYDYYGPDIGNNWWSSGSNPYGRLWRKLVWSATNYPLLDMQYGHDGAGNVTARFVSNTWGASWEGTRFSYDEHNRLIGAAPWPGYAGESESYGYDAIGNLTSKTGVGSYSYTTWGGCADGIKPHAVRTAGPNGYCYDANGNVTWRYEGGRLWLNSWTADNKLASAQEKSPVDWATNIGVATQYFYDADGQRMKRVSGGVTTIYIGDHTEYVQGIKWVQYYSLGGQRVAMRDNIGPTAGSVVWLHGDHLGSASIATADTGWPVTSSETRYTPYGEVRPGFGTGIPTNRKFTGQREEANIGLYDYGARFYSPTLGRFLSADTIVPGAGNPQALNRYAYVFNRPLLFTDPTGHDALGPNWIREFRDAHGRDPDDEDRQIRLFSLTRTGPVSGRNDWTAADWGEFHRRGRNYWFREDLTGRRTLSDFSNQISRLAQAYTDAEADQFVRAIALLYAGLPYYTRGPRAALAQGFGGDRITVSTCGGGREDACLWLDHRSVGFGRQFTNSDLEENTHHYAGHLLSGFYLGPSTNMHGTLGREIRQGVTERQDILATDMADVRLGAVAGKHGYFLQTRYIQVSELSGWIARGLAP